MRAITLLCLALISASFTASQELSSSSHQASLATVTIQVPKKGFKAGETIDVIVLLTAGPNGVYIAKNWSEAGGAIPGFVVEFKTLSGAEAVTCGMAGDGWGRPRPDLSKYLHDNFVLLGRGEIVGLRTSILCPTDRHGRYRIEANYSPRLPGTKEVAQLDETKGLVLTEVIWAKPVEISIY